MLYLDQFHCGNTTLMELHFLGHGGAVEEDKCISDYISYVINISPLLINQYFTCSDI